MKGNSEIIILSSGYTLNLLTIKKGKEECEYITNIHYQDEYIEEIY